MTSSWFTKMRLKCLVLNVSHLFHHQCSDVYAESHHGDHEKPPTPTHVMKWKHFPHYRSFVREIHRSPLDFPRKGQWRGALLFSLICVWTNGWTNHGEAGDLRRHCSHHDVTEMTCHFQSSARLPRGPAQGGLATAEDGSLGMSQKRL